MFLRATKNYSVLCAPRSGHFSMYNYFGLKYLTEPDSSGKRKLSSLGSVGEWLNSESKNKILVIRNPYSRLQSAIKHTENMNKGDDWTKSHSGLFLEQISFTKVDFEIIKFEKYNDYVTEYGPHVITTHSNCRNWQPIFERYYSKKQMDAEFAAYRKILSERKEISVDKWKKLTSE